MLLLKRRELNEQNKDYLAEKKKKNFDWIDWLIFLVKKMKKEEEKE